MPRRYKRRRTRRRKRGMRKSNRMTYTRIRTILSPDTLYVKLRYFQNINLTGLTSTGLVMRGNSVFDPNASGGTNTQPAGFDQYALLYDHYQVTGSACKVQLQNLGANPCRVYLLPQISESAPSQLNAAQQPYCKTRVLGSVNGNGQVHLSSFMRTKKLIGRNTNSINYAGPVTGNPTNQWFWQFNVQSLTSDDVDIDGQLILTYYVKFWHRKFVADA